jgi:Fe-S-cluster containining protein
MTKKQNCKNCDNCCKHIALEIDKPTTQQDYNNIVWYLMHENVKVFVDFDNGWYLEFATKCKALNKDKMCDIYTERPNICREYSEENCVKEDALSAEKYAFNSREEFLDYLEKKGKIYKFEI